MSVFADLYPYMFSEVGSIDLKPGYSSIGRGGCQSCRMIAESGKGHKVLDLGGIT